MSQVTPSYGTCILSQSCGPVTEKILWWMVAYNNTFRLNEAFYSILTITHSTSCHLCNVSFSYVSATDAYQQSVAEQSAEINDLLKSATAIEGKA